MNMKLFVARREKRVQQKELAELLHIHWTSYSRKERGVHEFTIAEAKKLANFFGCTLNDLFQEEESA